MGLFTNLRGIMSSLFQIGGPTGPQLYNSSGVIELKDATNTNYAQGRAAHIVQSSTTSYDVINLLMAQSRVAQIGFSFTGASAPSPGANTGKFGLAHTAGGGYAAGDVVYDTGTALYKLPTEICLHCTTTSAITGTVSMIANGFYSRDSGTWTMKGDTVNSFQGLTRVVEVSYAWNTGGGTISSTAAIESGARVLRVYNRVDTPFDGTSPTVEVVTDGTADQVIMATTDSNIAVSNTYLVEEPVDIVANTAGVVKVNIVPGAGAANGAGKIIVEYSKPFA